MHAMPALRPPENGASRYLGWEYRVAVTEQHGEGLRGPLGRAQERIDRVILITQRHHRPGINERTVLDTATGVCQGRPWDGLPDTSPSTCSAPTSILSSTSSRSAPCTVMVVVVLLVVIRMSGASSVQGRSLPGVQGSKPPIHNHGDP